MGWMQSDEDLTERSKFAIPSKTVRTFPPDKSAVIFKVLIIYKEGMLSSVSGKNPALEHTYDDRIKSGQF